jgi:hypothetical protein
MSEHESDDVWREIDALREERARRTLVRSERHVAIAISVLVLLTMLVLKHGLGSAQTTSTLSRAARRRAEASIAMSVGGELSAAALGVTRDDRDRHVDSVRAGLRPSPASCR